MPVHSLLSDLVAAPAVRGGILFAWPTPGLGPIVPGHPGRELGSLTSGRNAKTEGRNGDDQERAASDVAAEPVTRHRIVTTVLVLGVLSTTALVACGSGTTSESSTATASCGLTEFRKAKKPVDITMWHQMGNNNGRVFTAMIDDFNRSQGDVRVHLVDQS
ncbi:MAG: hypothetical protein JJE46_07560, partial [Acidimicrobiia bacterium]|nr:hypothetical protein [Acidimicrobiia bacterium]